MGCPLEAYLFDLDGTLVDSRLPMVRALNDTLEAFGRSKVEEEALVHRIGTPSASILGEVGGIPAHRLDEAVSLSRELYLRYQVPEVKLFPGVSEGLRRLEHIPLALVTIRTKPIAEAVLRAAALRGHFSAVVGWEEVSRPKPDPQGVLLALRALGARPRGAAFVGDRSVDVMAARAAGTLAIAVSYGYSLPGELEEARPDLVVDDLVELPL